MFTQMGLNNLWNDLKTGEDFLCQNIQIVHDSAQERCMKIYLQQEGRFAYFSSTCSSGDSASHFETWVCTTNWQPNELLMTEHEESFFRNQKTFPFSNRDDILIGNQKSYF
jgi:hypothetical protein